MNKLDRNYSIDYIKFFAIVAVVCIHTNPFSGTYILGLSGEVLDTYIIDILARFAVPFFFLCSGYLFSKKISANEHKRYTRTYLVKLTKLFLSWYLFYFIYGLMITVIKSYIANQPIFEMLTPYILKTLSINFFLYGSGGYASSHLWYLVALIWSIIICSLFLGRNKIKILVVIAFILNLVGLFGQTYSGIYYMDIQTRDTIFFALFYTSLGIYFGMYEAKILKKFENFSSKRLFTLFIVFSLLQIGERLIAEYFWSSAIKGIDYYFFTIFSSISLFLFVLKNQSLGKNSRLSKIGRNAVGIYVTHTLFISVVLLVFLYLSIEVTNYLVFHVLFTPIVLGCSHYYYSRLQSIKIKILNVN